jgi:hypothetical protein
VNLLGQVCAYLGWVPPAPARAFQIDAAEAVTRPGVLAVLGSEDAEADGVREHG